MNKFLGILLGIFLTSCASIERDHFEASEVLEKAMPLLQYEDCLLYTSDAADE